MEAVLRRIEETARRLEIPLDAADLRAVGEVVAATQDALARSAPADTTGLSGPYCLNRDP